MIEETAIGLSAKLLTTKIYISRKVERLQ